MSEEVKKKRGRKKKSLAETNKAPPAPLTDADYYHLDKILGLGAKFNIIWGQRSNGKTYAVTKYALERFRDKGHTFVYVRRWKDDVKVSDMDKLLDGEVIREIFGETMAVKYWRGAFKLYDTNEDSEFDPIIIGWAISLNNVHHTKSQRFPNCKTVILDEFLPRDGERVIKDEFDAWEQTLSTVLRTSNDYKVFLVGNSITRYSPYFTAYGIDVNNVEQGSVFSVKVLNAKQEPITVGVEWVKTNEKIAERTADYIVGSKMAVSGEWDIKDVANIPHCEGEIAKEKKLCTFYDDKQCVIVGIFVRKSVWTTLENVYGILTPKKHHREFLVIRQTDKASSYFHLTLVKDLKYTTYTDCRIMFENIKDGTGIDIINELKMGRVFSSDMYVADFFYHTYLSYDRVGIRELI